MRRIYSYIFRIAPWPHATGVSSACIGGTLLFSGVDMLAGGATLLSIIYFVPALGWFILALLCCLDGYSRYREYQRLLRIFAERGFSPRLLRPVASSRCQRDAAAQAVKDSGYSFCAHEYFRAWGYRWYHLLPDKVIKNPLSFFDIHFLRKTFLPSDKQ